VGHRAASQIRKRAQNEGRNVGCLFNTALIKFTFEECRMKADNRFINSKANDQK
jgi:hypothetical protein